MGIRAVTVFLAMLTAVGARTQEREQVAQHPEMTNYQFVLLVRGPSSRPMGEREIQSHQEAHLAYLKQMLDDDRAVVAGPVDGGEELRGIVVLDVGTVERARAIMADDPWVRAGRLKAEVHSWWTTRDVFRETDEFLHHETCYLGLLWRPETAPELSPEKLQEIQAGHMANIRMMAESGELLMAGPMEGDGSLRGVLVFRPGDSDRILQMAAEDPAIEIGRLGMELYPWNVPKGSLPAP
jgi:uncharacterized protein YciI